VNILKGEVNYISPPFKGVVAEPFDNQKAMIFFRPGWLIFGLFEVLPFLYFFEIQYYSFLFFKSGDFHVSSFSMTIGMLIRKRVISI
jgi:hypothetical protein